MNDQPSQKNMDNVERTYDGLIVLWTSGVRDYHSLLATYLTANSIFVAAIGFLLARQALTWIFVLLVLILCILGIFIALQMALVLGRFDAQNDFWEWQLRGIEHSPLWTRRKLFLDLYRFREQKESLEDRENIPPVFRPSWILRQHRRWWARRAISFPLFFGIIYVLFFAWGGSQLLILFPL